jgi:DNA polymerase I
VKKQVQVLDVDYRIVDEKPELRLFCKTVEGEDLLAVDRDFRPYFYALGDDLDELREAIEAAKFTKDGEELPVTEIKHVEKKDGNEEVEALQVFTTVPPNVPKIEKQVYELPEASECREYDIPFYKRYLIDNHVRPVKTVEIEGEEEENEDFDLAV